MWESSNEFFMQPGSGPRGSWVGLPSVGQSIRWGTSSESSIISNHLIPKVRWSVMDRSMFYGQISGVAMSSPLSLVIANFYMEDFQKVAFDLAPPKIPLLVLLCGWHLLRLVTWTTETASFRKYAHLHCCLQRIQDSLPNMTLDIMSHPHSTANMATWTEQKIVVHFLWAEDDGVEMHAH
jgi:hypothetical protein